MDDFSFLDLIGTIILVYALLVVLMLLFSIVADLFLDRELSGWAKAAWVVALLVFPLVGVVVYVIARHDGMMERATARRGGGPDAARQLAAAQALLDSGAISPDEYDDLKAKALA